VFTRVAVAADAAILLTLAAHLDDIGGRAERAVSPASTGDVHGRLLELVAGEASRVVVACLDDAPVGMAVMRLARPDPLSDSFVVQLAHVVVAPGHRHRGVGQALVESATVFAMEHQVDHVAVSVYPSLRDASRFYARLGFAPAATHRVAPVGLLRRRLGLDRPVAATAAGFRRRGRLPRPLPSQRARRRSGQQV
jgi:GNAT superfamily N-acetyltransferase